MKLTVKEYSTAYNVSIQSVYKRIQRRTIQWVKENNKIYVIADDKEVENSTQPVQSTYCTELLDIIGRRDKELKRVNKEIKRLTKELSKAQLHSMATMKGYIDKLEIMQLSAPIADSNDNIIDVKEKKSKKKDKKKKKGKKWK
jgi:hypothetical protein